MLSVAPCGFNSRSIARRGRGDPLPGSVQPAIAGLGRVRQFGEPWPTVPQPTVPAWAAMRSAPLLKVLPESGSSKPRCQGAQDPLAYRQAGPRTRTATQR